MEPDVWRYLQKGIVGFLPIKTYNNLKRAYVPRKPLKTLFTRPRVSLRFWFSNLLQQSQLLFLQHLYQNSHLSTQL